jgi:S-adenosylmethionine hydrolase
MAPPIIAILTDFGTRDPFVGIMKGVIAGIASQARTIDLTHEIPPGDLRHGALALWQSAQYFPDGTIFLCVVDPGVGTSRRGVIVTAEVDTIQGRRRFTFVGPDNGIFSYVLHLGFQAWELANPSLRLPDTSSTFHGRDIFAPAAAYTANGIPGSEFGPAIEQLVELPYPRLIVMENRAKGEILFADRFGNLLTSLGQFKPAGNEIFHLQPWVPGVQPAVFNRQTARLVIPGGELRLAKTFGELRGTECAGIVGSSGLLEIAANGKSAAELLGLKPGGLVELYDQRKDYSECGE